MTSWTSLPEARSSSPRPDLVQGDFTPRLETRVRAWKASGWLPAPSPCPCNASVPQLCLTVNIALWGQVTAHRLRRVRVPAQGHPPRLPAPGSSSICQLADFLACVCLGTGLSRCPELPDVSWGWGRCSGGMLKSFTRPSPGPSPFPGGSTWQPGVRCRLACFPTQWTLGSRARAQASSPVRQWDAGELRV